LPNEGTGADRGDPIQIPGQQGDFSARKSLQVSVSTFDKTIGVNSQGRIDFSVRNSSPAEEQNIDIAVLIPPGLELQSFTDADGNPIAANVQGDSQYFLPRRNEMRIGETIDFSAIVVGKQPGNYTLEINAISQNMVGKVTGTDTISVTQ
jgi:hypothetical protein